MRIDISSFRGEAPRLTPRALPLNGAQIAKNARLQSGDLEAWRQFVLTTYLAHSAPVESIYLLNDIWLSWEVDVDVARGIIPGDNTYRIYLTGPDLYDEPRYTNYALALGDGTTLPRPVETRPLGVPNPEVQPTVAPGISNDLPPPIDVLDNGDQIDSWILSPQVPGVSTVSEDPAVGNGPPSYTLVAINNQGDAAWLHRDFGIANAAVVEISFDFRFNGESLKRMLCNFLADENGAGMFVNWGESGVLNVGISTLWSSVGDSVLNSSALSAPSSAVWYTCTISVVVNADGTKTVNVTISNASVQLGSVSITSTFGSLTSTFNGHVGFILHVGAVPAAEFRTWYDNISVRATIQTVLDQVATSYVYTFVNDIGEESGPSPASATVLKDDGTAITVTTPIAVQSGFSVDYNVETKRIYRAVTGNTGTAFRFVAEIPLGTADYVDSLTDAELGDVLESEDWDLPPADLRGIIALPNGIMAGFRRNQLCLSAQNRPHAWPVKYRLNTDTDVVAIGNIDNTVVVGTQSFPYTAAGNDPAAYSMTKLEKKQACVSKRSLAHLTEIGIVFASPDGLVAVAGNGRIQNLTENIFTRRQWQALVPESILGVEHDDVYFFFPPGEDGYALDMKTTGFGLIELSFHANAAHSDPLTDKLYLALDALDEPGDTYLPVASTLPVLGGIVDSPFVFTEDFERPTPLADYTLLSGDTGPFSIVATPYGVGLRIETDMAFTPDTIRRMITPIEGVQLTARFMIDAHADDDAPEIVWSDGVTDIAFIPAREADFDPLQRAMVFIGAESEVITAARLEVDVWYKITINMSASLNATTATITRESDDAVIGSATFNDSHPPITVDRLLFYRDSGAQTPAAIYDNVSVGIATILGAQIFEFDSADAYGDLVYQYKGKLNRLPNPAAFMYCQVKADDYTNLMLQAYGDGGLLFTQIVTDKEPFTLPMIDQYETFEIECIGTSRVESVRFGESIEELMQEG